MERLNDWLNAADIHLLPQKAVAADLVLPSKRLGLCVTPEDVDAFTAAVGRLVDDPALRAAQGVRARQLAELRFGRETVLQRLEHQWLQELELQ